MNRVLAQALSYLLHPALFPLLGTFVVLKLSPYHYPTRIILLVETLVFCGTYVIPVAISLLLFRLKVLESLLMKQARERRLPYVFAAVSFYLTALLVKNIDLLELPYLFLLGSAAVIVVHLFMLPFLKPSAHLAGIGGFLGTLMALSLRYQLNLLVLIALSVFLCGLLAAARLKLKAHNNTELWLGFATGFLILFALIAFA